MLLVGSVYLDHARSEKWYRLQTEFLKKTTFNFHHVVYVNGTNNFYDKSLVLNIDKRPAKSVQDSHIRGLNSIISYFNSNLDYDSLLLLDSDCFPIHGNWQQRLDDKINPFNVAAVARYENLDTFAHPCAFYAKRAASKNLYFSDVSQTNIIGSNFTDTASNITKFFPLIRSNIRNYHPVLFGVYWNIFYHHGAGSRDLSFRLFYHYFNNDTNVAQLEQESFDKLVNSPIEFLSNINKVYLNLKMN